MPPALLSRKQTPQRNGFRAGRIVGIEIKASATIDANHFKGLKALAQAAVKRFVRGIVVHAGSTSIPFAPNLLALRVAEIWA